jgi:hypothetical protein
VLRCMSIDAGVRRCMRLGMRLPRSIHPPGCDALACGAGHRLGALLGAAPW